jgi:hypothetical protein
VRDVWHTSDSAVLVIGKTLSPPVPHFLPEPSIMARRTRRPVKTWPKAYRTALNLELLEDRLAPSITLGQQPGAPNNTQFHGDAAHTGFDQMETVLTPSNVAAGFGQVWQSPVLDGAVYATPLFMDSLLIAGAGNAANHAGDGVQSASFQNKSLGVVFAATGGGTVYAIAAQDTNGPTGIAPGTILWKTHLGNPYAGVDGNSIGVLSTPIIDLASGRLYVTASVTDYLTPVGTPNHGGNNFEVFALNLHDGSVVSGWPLIFTQSLLDSLNRNTLQGTGVAVAFSSSGADQRGALNLSADGSTLYVDWACYGASNPGWLTTVATGVTNGTPNVQTPAIVSAYSAIDTTAVVANGGMWGAGGPAIDSQGNVFVTTGDSPSGTGNPAGAWGNSVLEFGPGQTLTLTGVYTPWNYPAQDTIDSDLGGGAPIIITLPAGSSTTTELAAFGGKQGNGYLVDAGNHLNNPTPNPNNSPAAYPASLTSRPPGNLSPNQDASLYDTSPTGIRNYWQGFAPQAGPLSLFGPYNESSASGNTAKARDTPATFTGPDGSQYVIFAGSSKAGIGSSTPVAPSLILTKIVHSPGQPAYLQIVASNTAVMSNPGSNMVSGNGTGSLIDWIVDSGMQRTDSLTSFSAGAPTLYAYDALTMQPIWSSAYQEVGLGGKYNSVAVARGNVFVGTHRIQAFGLTGNTIVDDAVTGTGANQFTYTGTGWTHVTGSSTMGTFYGTVSTDNVQGDFTTLTFTGSQIRVYANEKSGYGTATFTVDGGNLQTVMLSPANSSPNGQGAGDVLVYTVTGLGPGTHTLKILNNAANNIISIDRVEITPPAGAPAQLGISMTDGNIIPTAQGVIPYTINYNNAGSIVNGTGTNATGVVVTATVPANTTADLANSTPGWTLTSGNGGAGSTFTFTVGNLAAGVTGSLVFSVDLNANIPVGTTTITNTVTISDSAGDHASGSRSTPIPPPAEAKLVFSVGPPATGSAGIALSPPIQVAALDQFNNTFTADSSSTVTLTLSGGGTFVGGGNTVTAQLSNGVATFSNLIISSAGTYTLTATDGLLAGATSSSFTIAASSKLAFTQQPTQTVAGVAISPAVAVAIEDQAGNVIATDNSIVTLTLSSGSFANGSTTVTAHAINGVATFSNLMIDAAGSYNLTASDGALPSTRSNPFNIVGQASQLVFTQQPNNTYAGEAINPSVAVALEDRFGNVDTGNMSAVTLTLSGGTFFGGGTTATAVPVNGVASFNNLVVTAPGTYTLTATDPGLTSAVSYSFVIGTHALVVIDDNNANNTGGIPQVVYSSPTTRWVQTPTSLANNVGGTITTDSTGGDTATVTFTGTLITLYAAETPDGGSAQIFIDGNSPAQVNLTSPTAVIAPVFTSPLLTAGSHTIVVKVVSGNVSIDRFVVGPATPTLAWATPADLTFGSPLDGTQLDAFVSNFPGFAGTFSYSPSAGTVLPVGQGQPLRVTFTPADTANYAPANATVLINVVKATPVITWTGPNSNMTFGQALGPAQLNATATVNGVTIPGTFVYTPGAGTVPPTGQNFELSVTFTPTDTVDYNTVTAQSDVDVDPATPVITWANPADIIDGTPLSSTQLAATANVPGTFTYSPAAGTVLGPGQHQALGVVFTPTDLVDYNVTGKTVFINVNYGAAAKLAFLQQPNGTTSGTVISPAVRVAVEDAAGSVLPGDTSTVTLTLSNGGTFVDGGNIVSAQAVNGVATFSSLAIANNGVYSLTATDDSLTSAVSNTFQIGATAFDNFNSGASSFTAPFATNLSGVPGGTALTWGAAAGIGDQAGGAAGGGVVAAAADETAVYTPATFNLSDGAVHTISEFVTAPAGSNAADRLLQLGFITAQAAGFNAGFSFISARIFGDRRVEFQSGNGAGTTAVSLNTTAPTGAIANGDWLQLVLTTQEIASGSFTGTFSLLDYGPTGLAAPRMVLAPVSYTVSGLNTIGAGAAMYAGFRTATGGGASPLEFDNFLVDPAAAKMAFVQQPSSGGAGEALGTFVAAVEDINSNILVGDSSVVTLTLSHDTFANGQTTVSAQAVNGIATFSNLVISTPGSYILRATDSNPNLDPGFAPFTINATTATKLAFLQQPTNAIAGLTVTPAVTVAVKDANGNTVSGDTSVVTLMLSSGSFAGGATSVAATAVNGVATFSNLVINTVGSYTVSASDGTLTGATSNPFTISAPTSAYLDFNAGASSFTSNFAVFNNGGANNTSLSWGSAFGVQDQPGPAAGGGVRSAGSITIDSTAIYTPSTVNLSDGQVHTISEYFTAVSGLGSGDKPLQLGYLAPASTGFNANFSFISARMLGNGTVEFQSANGGAAVSANNTRPTGTINPGDWLDLVLTTQETASGSFRGTFSLIDYGPGGVGPGVTVLAPVSWSVSGLTNLGTASAVSAGFRTATTSAFTGRVAFDNLAIDPPAAAKLAYLSQPSAGTAGAALGSFVVAVEDAAGHTVSSNTSTVTLTLNHGTFANGQTTVSATAVNGVAVFSGLVINATGSYILSASDGALTAANSGSFTIIPAVAAKLGFLQQPTITGVGAAISPAVTVAVQDALGNTVAGNTSTVTLTLSSGSFAGGSNTVSAAAVNGVATFGNLVINAVGSYTLSATDGALTGATSNPFTVSPPTSACLDFNSGASSFTSNFAVFNNGGANNTSLSWGSAFGVQDQPGPAAGGGVRSAGSIAIDSTAIYTPSTVNLSDGQVHTISEYFTAVSGLSSSDKPLQLGYLAPTSTGFNAGFSFISARMLGNGTVEFQWNNGGATATPLNNTRPTGTINPGDWLDLVLTTQETASGSFRGTFSLIDYGPGGVGPGVTVLAPVSWSVSGLTNLGTASAVSAGFRSQTPATFTGHVAFDNLAIDPPPAAKVAYLAQPSAGTAGVGLGSFVVAVEDAAGHTVSSNTSTVTLTLNGGSFAGGGNTVTASAVNGVAVFSNLVINAAGSYTLTAADDGLTGANSGSFTINPAASAKVVFVQQPTNATAGTAISPAVGVAVEDIFGNTVTGDASTVTLTLSSASFAGGGNTVSASAVNGVATFSGLVINAAGAYTLAAADDSLTGAVSGSFTVSPAAAANLAFLQQPTSATAGATISPTVTVAVEDAFGNTVTGDTSLVTLTLSGAFASGGSTVSASAVNGVATFDGLVIDAAGSYTLAAADDGLTGANSGSFTISPAPAAKLGFLQQPSNASAGTAISPAVSVAVEDAFGNTVSSDTSVVTLTLGAGSFAGGTNTVTATAVNGVAVFSSLIINAAGSYTLSASDGALTAANSGSFTINPAAASKLAFLQQPTNATAGAAISPAVRVAVEDIFGNTVTGDASTVTLVLSGGAFANGTTSVTAPVVNGVAVFDSLVINAAGSYSLTATDGSLSGAASGSFTVSPAAASKLVFLGQPSNSTAGATISPAVSVAVKDAFGNTITGDASAVTLTLSHGAFANGTTSVTASAVNGVATFSSLVINAAGSYTLTASDRNLTAAVSSTFTINPGAAVKLAFLQQPTNTVAGTAISPAVSVAVEDIFGNTVSTDASTVTLTLSQGAFVGGKTVTATAVHGVATFGNLVIHGPRTYTLTASDGAPTAAVSNSFTIYHVRDTDSDDSHDDTVSCTDAASASAMISSSTKTKLFVDERN